MKILALVMNLALVAKAAVLVEFDREFGALYQVSRIKDQIACSVRLDRVIHAVEVGPRDRVTIGNRDKGRHKLRSLD